MKFTYAVAALVAAAASVQATETNAHRLARGLNPLPPRNFHHHASRTRKCLISFFFRQASICLASSVASRAISANLKSSTEDKDAKKPKPSGTPSDDNGNCNTGPVQCCNAVSKANDNVVSKILGLIGVSGVGDDVLVGLQCSPLSVAGVGHGSSCTQRPVCCENNSHGGLVSIGCIPIFL